MQKIVAVRNCHSLTVVTIAVAVLALTALSASAQYGYRSQKATSLGVSYAWGSDPDGFRLEYIREKLVWDGGYFSEHGDKVCALEVGLLGGEDGELLAGRTAAIGAGWYREDFADGTTDSDIGWWAGFGDFNPRKKGLFTQFRYHFSGPLNGSTGIFGWRF